MDDHPPATSRGLLDLDFRAECNSKFLFERRDLIGLGSLAASGGGWERDRLGFELLNVIADRLFRVPNAHPFRLDALAEVDLLDLVTQRQQRPSVTGRDLPATDCVQHAEGQFEQSHQVGDRRAIDLQTVGEIFLRTVMLVEISFERHGLLDRIEILALQVLDDRQFGDQPIVGFT